MRFPPFWANAIAESKNVLYDGMYINATNTDRRWENQTVVWNTDGIDTYRSDRITMKNWDVTCGDDCIAVKGVGAAFSSILEISLSECRTRPTLSREILYAEVGPVLPLGLWDNTHIW